MIDRDEQRKIRKVKQLSLPIITFDDILDSELRARGIDTAADSSGQLDELETDRSLTLFDYFESIGLIPMEE